MTEPTPVAVMDAQDLAQEGPARQHRLDWLRAEGIDPDTAFHVELFDSDNGPYAVITSSVREDGHLVEERFTSGELPLFTVRRPVASLPPREAAVYDLAARVQGIPEPEPTEERGR